MAKKFVRGITDIKTISNQDFDTNNVNDLLSDGKHNYIHRKKQDGSEEYHNLTNNLKTIQSDDTDLLTVTNYNNTTNSATIRPKHDSQKEQLLESTDESILISHGENGTEETTNVDVNPEIVLEHENLTVGYGLKKVTNDGVSSISLKPTLAPTGFDLNLFFDGKITGQNIINAPSTGWYLVNSDWFTEGGKYYIVQTCVGNRGETINTSYKRVFDGFNWCAWEEQVENKSAIDTLLAQKQNTLTSNASIGVDGTGLQQLYTQSQTYTHANGILKTHVKSVANSASVDSLEEEFNFLAKMDKSQTNAEFTLNEHDTAVFQYLIDTYGLDNKINVCGSAFTLNGSQLTFGSNGSVYNPHIITFTDIIPTSAINTNP